MKPVYPFLAIIFSCGALLLTSLPAMAGLDIVESKSSDESVWVVKETSSGKVLGTFWKPADQTSAFGYENLQSDPPEFTWSKDRTHVAVKGGSARSQQVYLYEVTGDTLKAIEIPALSDKEMAPITKLDDVIAEGSDAVAWQADGTLLLHYWADNRVSSETEKQKRGEVWAFVQVKGGKAKILRTTTKKP